MGIAATGMPTLNPRDAEPTHRISCSLLLKYRNGIKRNFATWTRLGLLLPADFPSYHEPPADWRKPIDAPELVGVGFR
jgi:hypothetical protein